QRALGHLLQAQRGDDLVDVGLFLDDRLPVDLADRADQALRVPRGIVGAVQLLQLLVQVSEPWLEAQPEPVQDGELALLTLCMSPVIAVGTMSDVLRYHTRYRTRDAPHIRARR